MKYKSNYYIMNYKRLTKQKLENCDGIDNNAVNVILVIRYQTKGRVITRHVYEYYKTDHNVKVLKDYLSIHNNKNKLTTYNFRFSKEDIK